LAPNYRLAPLAAVNESYTWKLPDGIAPGPVTVKATVWYSRVVSSVAEHLKIRPRRSSREDVGARHDLHGDEGLTGRQEPTLQQQAGKAHPYNV